MADAVVKRYGDGDDPLTKDKVAATASRATAPMIEGKRWRDAWLLSMTVYKERGESEWWPAVGENQATTESSPGNGGHDIQASGRVGREGFIPNKRSTGPHRPCKQIRM
jgi:hypothetical protein